MMTTFRITLLAMVMSLGMSQVGSAGGLTATSYDLLNGELGGDVPNFFDDTYSGTGNRQTVKSPLSGGLGDLTDGVVATTNWNGQYLRYVGWYSIDPQVTFHFSSDVAIDNIRFHFDDAKFGGVFSPASVTIRSGTNSLTRSVVDPSGNGPFAFDFGSPGFAGRDFEITIFRSRDGSNNPYWVMVSEIEFTGTVVTSPVP
ncbi:MAG: hypothetical protein ACKOGA_04485 [Planctomycetaceae bacterium]